MQTNKISKCIISFYEVTHSNLQFYMIGYFLFYDKVYINNYFFNQFLLFYLLLYMKEEKRKSMLKYLLSNNKNHPPKQHVQINLSDSNAVDNKQQPQGTNKMEKSIKRIGTKQTIKSFHTNVGQNHQFHQNQIEPVKINVLTKAKITQDNEYNQKQFRKKLKRVGKKVWASAYKQSVDQKQEEQQKNINLLNPNSPSDNDYFSEFKQSTINASEFSNKSRCIEVSERQDNMQSFLNISEDQKFTNKKEENVDVQKQQVEKDKQFKILVNKKQTRDGQMQVIKQRNQNINTFYNNYNNYNNFTQISDTNKQLDNKEIDIEKVLEEIEISHPHQRKQSFKIKTCQSKKIIEIAEPKKINTSSKKRNSKFATKQPYQYRQKLKTKQQDDAFSGCEQKNKEKEIQESSQMKNSKKPLLPAYPFNQQKQSVNLGIQIQKRSSNYRAKALQLKKQSSVNIVISEQKSGQKKDEIKQMALQVPNRMIKSLNNSAHQKQNTNHKPMFQKIKTSEHYSSPKMTNSIKKSIRYYQMNKCILQARKQLGKQHFYV